MCYESRHGPRDVVIDGGEGAIGPTNWTAGRSSVQLVSNAKRGTLKSDDSQSLESLGASHFMDEMSALTRY
jgi:hypothetical protein